MTETIDMGRLNDWLESVRNTFINASELAGKVAGLQAQVNEMTQGLESLRSINRTLDENLSWSRGERDRLDSQLRQSQTELETVSNAKRQLETDMEYWQKRAEERMSIIATLRNDHDTVAFKNLELEEENGKLKAMIDGIQKALYPLQVVAPEAVSVKVVEDKIVEIPAAVNSAGQVQPRDPVTQQWKSPKELEDEAAHKADPWWMHDREKQSSEF